MKCSYCNSCLKIHRVELDDIIANYLVCYLCGRIFYNNFWQAIEVKGEEGDKVRKYLGLTKIGKDEDASGTD